MSSYHLLQGKQIMHHLWLIMLICFGMACSTNHVVVKPAALALSNPGGAAFYRQAAAMGWQSRDSLVLDWFGKGFVPEWLTHFVPVKFSAVDSVKEVPVEVTVFVSPDYLSVGTDNDWARVCITPMAAQSIATTWDCSLPTTKIVDAVYHAAALRLDPVPLFAFRDSTPTMWHHHLIIEGQRQLRKGLIAGIKKDVVQTPVLLLPGKQNKVAIYGWHKPDGNPIQPLYTGHVNWYVDYSHGIRLVYNKVLVNKKEMQLAEVLRSPALHHTLCQESGCNAAKHSSNN